MLKDFTTDAINHFTEHEGRVNHFYRDTVGLVTIGIGCQVFVPFKPAAYGIWVEAASGVPCDIALVHADYNAILTAPLGMVAPSYQHLCKTRLTDQSIDSLFIERLSKIEHELAIRIMSYETLPDPAQFALLDMGFNLGVTKLMATFPKFVEAVNKRQFALAAKESARSGAAWAARNKWTADKFMESENV